VGRKCLDNPNSKKGAISRLFFKKPIAPRFPHPQCESSVARQAQKIIKASGFPENSEEVDSLAHYRSNPPLGNADEE
jgi:hypothetical protein